MHVQKLCPFSLGLVSKSHLFPIPTIIRFVRLTLTLTRFLLYILTFYTQSINRSILYAEP